MKDNGLMEKKEDHPFPNKELRLVMKWSQEGLIPIEEVSAISDLIHKYLNLRCCVFYPHDEQ